MKNDLNEQKPFLYIVQPDLQTPTRMMQSFMRTKKIVGEKNIIQEAIRQLEESSLSEKVVEIEDRLNGIESVLEQLEEIQEQEVILGLYSEEPFMEVKVVVEESQGQESLETHPEELSTEVLTKIVSEEITQVSSAEVVQVAYENSTHILSEENIQPSAKITQSFSEETSQLSSKEQEINDSKQHNSNEELPIDSFQLLSTKEKIMYLAHLPVIIKKPLCQAKIKGATMRGYVIGIQDNKVKWCDFYHLRTQRYAVSELEQLEIVSL